MAMALLWLTVSLPIVFESQKNLTKQEKTANAGTPLADNEEEAANLFGNTTEEKASGGSSLSEEYLHDSHINDLIFSVNLQHHKCENAGIYIAFHGELHVPPPNAA